MFGASMYYMRPSLKIIDATKPQINLKLAFIISKERLIITELPCCVIAVETTSYDDSLV